MEITLSQLRRIIREEVTGKKPLREGELDRYVHDHPGRIKTGLGAAIERMELILNKLEGQYPLEGDQKTRVIEMLTQMKDSLDNMHKMAVKVADQYYK